MKKTLITLLAIVVYTFHASAQERGFQSIGLDVSTHASYRQSISNLSILPIVNVPATSSGDMLKFQMGVALHGMYQLNSSFGLITGLGYHQYGYKTFDRRNLVFEDQIDATRGVIDPNGVSAKAYSRYSYLSVPIKLYWQKGESKLRFVSNLGASLGYLTSATNVVKFENSNKTSNSIGVDFNPINVMLEGGFGFYYQTDSRIGCKIENVFRFGMLKLSDTPTTVRLYNFGSVLGVFYTLNKN